MTARRCIGLLAEKYSKWERRAALTPLHVQRLVYSGIDVLVQPSTSRVYSDAEYRRAGASLTPDLSDATAILGVKQPANGTLLPEKTYLVFSHVIKAQVPYTSPCAYASLELLLNLTPRPTPSSNPPELSHQLRLSPARKHGAARRAPREALPADRLRVRP